MNLPPSPEASARSHRLRPTIGLLTHGAGDPNSQAVWEGVQSATREHGAHVICFPGKPLCSPHGFEAQSNIIYELAGPQNVDGLVIWAGALCHRVDLPVITDFCRRYLPLPVVTVGHPLIPDIIEPGFDILNPVQISAANMAPAELKARFGDRITFWGGGVDTQRTLPFGTPDEVRAEVRQRLEIFGKGGGFVFSTIHNVQAGVPVEDLLAMYETVREYGGYQDFDGRRMTKDERPTTDDERRSAVSSQRSAVRGPQP